MNIWVLFIPLAVSSPDITAPSLFLLFKFIAGGRIVPRRGSQSEIKLQRGQIYFAIVAAARNRRVRRVPRRYIFHDLSARARARDARSLAACGMEKLFSLVGRDIFAIMNRARAISLAHMHTADALMSRSWCS